MIGDKIKRQPGFSLIEMLLVVLIFSIASTVLSQIFIQITRLERRVSNTAVLSQDMRFATELLVRAARSNYIDYGAAPLPTRSSSLVLDTLAGGRVQIATSTNPGCNDTSVTSCLALSVDGGATWNIITSKRVNVTNFDVYVRPSVSPFTTPGVNNQPMVTVNLGLQYMADNPNERVSLQAQTSVSSRLYQR